MTQLKYLNLGCGRIILPGPRPEHHSMIDEAIYAYPLWHNVDKHPEPGIDETLDIFRYPWPWADNSFDGALLAHIVEHIPHEIKRSESSLPQTRLTIDDGTYLTTAEPMGERWRQLANCQDGWYAFWAELHRVLTPGALVHVLSPYAWSAGAMTDPSHTRYITEHVFTHSMKADPASPFYYETAGLHFEIEKNAQFRVTEMFKHLVVGPDDSDSEIQRKAVFFYEALMTNINVAYEINVVLRAVK